MRLYLLLVFAAGTVQAQDPRPFSHRLHLKLQPDCTACHVTAKSSTKIEDNNLPAASACVSCHKEASIKRPAPTLLSRFDHQKHLKLGNIAPLLAKAVDSGAYLSRPGGMRRHLNTKNSCAACHRGLEESEAVTKAAFPQMADCLVCHTEVDPPFSCEFCHAKGPHLKPANHTPDWLDLHNSKKVTLDKPSCAVCHGRKFTCLGCH
ncbi:MAG: cytochrome c3 family protein [Bryobacteraceae bacterium]